MPKHHPTPPEEIAESAEFLEKLNGKAIVGFLGTLMLFYSFFGNIYRVPMQLEQQGKDLAVVQAAGEKNTEKVISLERYLATKEDTLAEVGRSRARIESLERVIAAQGSMQQQLDRMDNTFKDLARILDSVGTKMTELHVTVQNLKETSVETRRMVDEVKRKQP